MWGGFRRFDRATIVAMAGAATIGAQFVAGRAARDALFLAHFDPTALPPMIIGTSLFAVVLVVISAKTFATIAPDAYVPAAFAVNAMILLGVWRLGTTVPRVAAPLLYLLVSGVGPLLSSGFWLMASERFDPRTAKKRFGQIGAAGTVGGLVAGLAAARVSSVTGVEAIIPLLAALNLIGAWQTRSWGRRSTESPRPDSAPAALPSRSGLRVLADTHYLRHLAIVMLLATVAAGFVDYVFKVQAKASLEAGPRLGSFFSLYYAAVSLLSFGVQAFASRTVLERLGLSAAMSAASLAVVAGGTAALVNPMLSTIVATRGGEAVLRGSLLRAGYEVFYTPIETGDKRAVKAVVDVGVDRFGDILAAGVIQILVWTAIDGWLAPLLGLAVGCSLVALVLANGLSRGYVNALEQSLRNRALELDLADVEDRETRTVVLETLRRPGSRIPVASHMKGCETVTSVSTELEIQEIRALRSRDAHRVRPVLCRDAPLPPALVPHAIKLLDWDVVADDAVHALRIVANQHVGELIDALTDPVEPFAVRRRVARVFSVCSSQRAADGLVFGLEDLRFEVRMQCGRSLSAVIRRNPRIHVDPARLSAIVLREVAVSRRVWESRRLIDGLAEDRDDRSPLDELVDERASRALAHVFTLLELILPADPLRIAYRGLHTTDKGLRGTALEYLESVLPHDIRERLWPFLEPASDSGLVRRARDEILEDLLRSNQSIVLNLEELKARREMGV